MIRKAPSIVILDNKAPTTTKTRNPAVYLSFCNVRRIYEINRSPVPPQPQNRRGTLAHKDLNLGVEDANDIPDPRGSAQTPHDNHRVGI